MPLTPSVIKSLDDQKLLDLALEEAAEMIQALIKCKRFGGSASHPSGKGNTNVVALGLELVQSGNLIREYLARYGERYADISDLNFKLAAEQEKKYGSLG